MTDSPPRSPAIRIRFVGLDLLGERLEPDLVTAETGLTPSAGRQPASGRWDLDGSWFEGATPGHWSFVSTSVVAPGASLDDHLQTVLGAGAEAASRWRRLAEEHELHVRICVSSDPDARPPRLDEVLALATPAFAAAVRDLAAHVSVDVVY